MAAFGVCAVKILHIISVVLLIVVRVSANENDEDPAYDPELYGDFFEGDMDVFSDNGDAILTRSVPWPNKTVYYIIAENYFTDEQEYHIKLAMFMIQEASCVRFEEATPETPYFLNITGELTGCHATIGFQHRILNLNLEPYPVNEGCFKFGTIQHELLHVLGFFHQQSAPNRDEYVRILNNNIERGRESYFTRLPKYIASNFGVEYDYGSVMHLRPYAFTKNGRKTILSLADTKIDVGQRRSMSPADIVKLNIMYECVHITARTCKKNKSKGKGKSKSKRKSSKKRKRFFVILFHGEK